MTYAPAYAAGNAASIAPVEKFCIDCGGPFYPARNRASGCKRCPACQEAHNADRHREYQAIRERNRRGGLKFGAWRLVADPCDSWGVGASLNLSAWRDQAKLGQLDAGMIITDGRTTYRVEMAGAARQLRRVFDGN